MSCFIREHSYQHENKLQRCGRHTYHHCHVFSTGGERAVITTTISRGIVHSKCLFTWNFKKNTFRKKLKEGGSHLGRCWRTCNSRLLIWWARDEVLRVTCTYRIKNCTSKNLIKSCPDSHIRLSQALFSKSSLFKLCHRLIKAMNCQSLVKCQEWGGTKNSESLFLSAKEITA